MVSGFVLQSSAACVKVFPLKYRQAMGPTTGMVLPCPSAAFSFLRFFVCAKRKGAFFCAFAGRNEKERGSPVFAFAMGAARAVPGNRQRRRA
jgi:hypothetical protein